MAKTLTITKNDTPESIKKKMEEWYKTPFASQRGFPAYQFTGKIKSFGDPIEYQRRIRNEWE